jgi:endonuclease YncB( thermonuclease family)
VRHASRALRRNVGFVAVGLLAVGAILLQQGYLHPSAGARNAGHFTATAIDGDSLRAAGKQIRLYGIDAPELHQTCADEHGITWACGQQAHALLRTLTSRGLLRCTSRGTDRYGRTLATCAVGNVDDIGDTMVRAGLAVSFMSTRYWLAELEARWNERGIWRGTFEQPAEWRRRHPR